MKIGLDVGSTTIKSVVLDSAEKIVYKCYERHFSQITAKAVEMLTNIKNKFKNETFSLVITGSAGMGMADYSKVDFVQEVYATKVAADKNIPDADVIIELGGEDAKIIFLGQTMEARMNGTCAGGTGAFIDQMSTLLDVPISKMNDLAAKHERIYTIASRCGVFAKSDIQPLLNQGAKKSDIAASIFYAVVNQTIGGLAQGRPVEGNIVYLGGPLTFMPELRKAFDNTLGLKGICPENSLYYVSLGAAYCAKKEVDIDEVIQKLSHYISVSEWNTLPPLFENKEEYEKFVERHKKADVKYGNIDTYKGKTYIGIDAGSTTIKAVVIGEKKEILHSVYLPNSGNPVPIIQKFLTELYEKHPDINIVSSCVTGYGEDIIKNAFHVDLGLVETMAHFTAAKYFMPDVEFIIDIGGQDMKCFKIKNGVIDNIYLNEACSSGCGSFLQTFANTLCYSVEEFSKLGLFSKNAVDLGSRCTVFMNSSVKQAQKDGATTGDISAGLSTSIVKNAIYKVIRPSSIDELGKKIVVQGGTFLNDAVLRAFERELGVNVVRPVIAGLMGAYGCAIYAADTANHTGQKSSSILTLKELKTFSHSVKTVNCGLCSNKCRLTVNTFGDGSKYIGGNRCERPVTKRASTGELNIYKYKQELLKSLTPVKGNRGTIGLPLGLNMYEMAPFWYRFFTELGFEVIISPLSDRSIFLKGQATIPSDTVCFPAKMLHGHVKYLMEKGVDAIFYPCMSFNFDENLGDNNYNCPVVAYYPEIIAANMKMENGVRFINDYVGVHKRHDFPKKLAAILSKYYSGIKYSEIKKASDAAFTAHDSYLEKVRAKGDEIIKKAEEEGKRIIVLAGRPYHVDPEINHGIDMLLESLGLAVISEDVLSGKMKRFHVNVLNQWTYHSRLYAAAKYILDKKNMELVQLVSFGCGLDAITTDEVRSILENGGKIYTQIKIDEITNLGTVKVRLRSLLAALHQQEVKNNG
jgi:predicted CoA-substrate-specific enzyme activase